MRAVGQKKTIRLKVSFGRDIVFSVMDWAVKTQQSLLLQSVVRALCNNFEFVKLIKKYGHGISYHLVEEIKTEYMSDVNNKQQENSVVLPASVIQEQCKSIVALIMADKH